MNADQGNTAKNLADTQTQARDWWVRVNGGNMDALEQSRFQTWLNANPLHQSAFEDINSLWRELDGIKDLIADVMPATKPKPRRIAHWRWAIPACLLVAVLYPSASIKLRADESTDIAETRTVRLADGSTVQLNSESALSIHITTTARELNLLQGEAQFTVSPDPNRPFKVRAGNGIVTALGTVFNVRHSRQGVEVTVTEHKVAVKLDGNPANQATQAIVAQGQQVAYDQDNGLSAVKTVDTRIATAWQRGKLVVQDKPLGEVLAELNHYHRGYFVVADPTIAQHRINGVFNTDNPIGALNAIEKFQHLHSNRLSHYLVLLHR
ncbi:MAG: FecR family protein [Methylococcaceae bacterium]|nr:FecR family protein [Methylococcaceae bacterium]